MHVGTPRLPADFNGLFGDVLCLSHEDTCPGENGKQVPLRRGMIVTAYDEDVGDDGRRDDLIASGVVEPSPSWLQCTGSRWALRIDQNGVRNESDLRPPVQP